MFSGHGCLGKHGRKMIMTTTAARQVRTALLLLLTCLVITMFFSCTGVTGDPDTSSGGSSSAAETSENATEPFVFAENGEACCAVIRSVYADDMTAGLADNVRKKIQTLLGQDVELKTDYTPNGTHRDDTYEIILGQTSYEQAEPYLKELKYCDYAVIPAGRKIFILGFTSEALTKAANTFIYSVLPLAEKTDGGRVSVSFGPEIERGEYPLEGLTIAGEPVEKYTLIASSTDSSFSEAAEKLAESFGINTGYKPAVAKDTGPAGEREILVGPTARTDAECINGKYSVYVSGNSLVFAVAGIHSAEVAAEAFFSELKNRSTVPDIGTGFHLSEVWADHSAEKLADGADIRIMSFNILSERYGIVDYAGSRVVDYTASRAELLGILLEAYRPDIAGVQEVCANWKKYLDIYGGNYRLINATRPDNGENYSVLLYDTTRYDLVDNGVVPYSQGNSLYGRNMGWGVFRSRESGKQIAVISTHLDIHKDPAVNDANRMVQVNELTAFVKNLQEKYKCPVFATGDFNSMQTSTEITTFRSGSGMWCSKFDAAKTLNDYGSIPGFGAKPVSGGNVIDYVFGTPDTSCLCSFIITGNSVSEISDHRPVIADIKLSN